MARMAALPATARLVASARCTAASPISRTSGAASAPSATETSGRTRNVVASTISAVSPIRPPSAAVSGRAAARPRSAPTVSGSANWPMTAMNTPVKPSCTSASVTARAGSKSKRSAW
jgi:hypothetical protein